MTKPEPAAPVAAPIPETCRVRAAELRVLIGRATASDLTDDGRYFADTFDDLTRCRHEEIGEYQHRHDGPLVEWLWNRRDEIAALYEARATVEAK